MGAQTQSGPGSDSSAVIRGLTGNEVPAVNQSAIPALEGERWLPVPGFGMYEVSNHARVWSYHGNGRLLTPVMYGPPGYKYPGVVLCNGPADRWRAKLHQIVMLAFVGPCPDGEEVRHLDGNVMNNRWEPGNEAETRAAGGNLVYGTHAANQRDQIAHGTLHLAVKVGSMRLNAKLTEELVPVIRAEYAAGGVTERDLSVKYGINVSTLHRMLVRQTWKHVA
jgi:hypothetical protein